MSFNMEIIEQTIQLENIRSWKEENVNTLA